MERESYNNCTFNIYYRDVYFGAEGRTMPPIYKGNRNHHRHHHHHKTFQPLIRHGNYYRNYKNSTEQDAIRVFPQPAQQSDPSISSDRNLERESEQTCTPKGPKDNSNYSIKDGGNSLPCKPLLHQHSNMYQEKETKQASKNENNKSNSKLSTQSGGDQFKLEPSVQTSSQHSNLNFETFTEQSSGTGRLWYKRASDFLTETIIEDQNLTCMSSLPQHNVAQTLPQMSACQTSPSHSRILFNPQISLSEAGYSNTDILNHQPLLFSYNFQQILTNIPIGDESLQNDKIILDQRRSEDLNSTSFFSTEVSKVHDNDSSNCDYHTIEDKHPEQNLGNDHADLITSYDESIHTREFIAEDKNDSDQSDSNYNKQSDTDSDSSESMLSMLIGKRMKISLDDSCSTESDLPFSFDLIKQLFKDECYTDKQINEEPLYENQSVALTTLNYYKTNYWTIYPGLKPVQYYISSFNYFELSEEIWNTYSNERLTRDKFVEKISVCERLFTEILRKTKWSVKEFQFFLVGSITSGLALKSSDVNIVALSPPLSVDENAITGQLSITEFLKYLSSICNVKDVKTDYNVNPRIQLVWEDDTANSSVQLDITLNDRLALTRTQLNHLYSKCDWRFRVLFIVLKLWAESHGLINKPDSLLSPYSISLLLIYFLQRGIFPSVLPVLRNQMADFPLTLGDSGVNPIGISKDSRLNWKSNNSMSVGELLMWFFWFYDNYEFPKMIINTEQEYSIKRKEDVLEAYLYIEDPLMIGNIIKVPNNKDDCAPIILSIRKANHALQQGASLKVILLPD